MDIMINMVHKAFSEKKHPKLFFLLPQVYSLNKAFLNPIVWLWPRQGKLTGITLHGCVAGTISPLSHASNNYTCQSN